MFNTPVEAPDKISTLELSKIWLYKALENLERELAADSSQEDESPVEDEDSSAR